MAPTNEAGMSSFKAVPELSGKFFNHTMLPFSPTSTPALGILLGINH
jgi:hypothetical protein